MTLYERLIDMKDRTITEAINVMNESTQRRPTFLLGTAHGYEVSANLLTIEQAEMQAGV
jgi:hypothetical protein